MSEFRIGDAFAFSIPTHRASWDGSVCKDAVDWECGASLEYRFEHCAERSNGGCMSKGAFATGAKLRACEETLLRALDEAPQCFDGRYLILHGTTAPEATDSDDTWLHGIYLVGEARVVPNKNEQQVIITPMGQSWTRFPSSAMCATGLRAVATDNTQSRLRRVPRSDVLRLISLLTEVSSKTCHAWDTTDDQLQEFLDLSRSEKLNALRRDREASVPRALSTLSTLRIRPANAPDDVEEIIEEAEPVGQDSQWKPPVPDRSNEYESVADALAARSSAEITSQTGNGKSPSRLAALPRSKPAEDDAPTEKPRTGVAMREPSAATDIAEVSAGREGSGSVARMSTMSPNVGAEEIDSESLELALKKHSLAEGVEPEDVRWLDMLLRAGEVVLLLGPAADAASRARSRTVTGGTIFDLALGASTICLDDLFVELPSAKPTALSNAMEQANTHPGLEVACRLRCIDASPCRLWLDPLIAWSRSSYRPSGLALYASVSVFAARGDLPRGIEQLLTPLCPRFVENAAERISRDRLSPRLNSNLRSLSAERLPEHLTQAVSDLIDDDGIAPTLVDRLHALARTVPLGTEPDLLRSTLRIWLARDKEIEDGCDRSAMHLGSEALRQLTGFPIQR